MANVPCVVALMLVAERSRVLLCESVSNGTAVFSSIQSPSKKALQPSCLKEPDDFCWWALELSNPNWELYSNGMSDMIESNIRHSCRKVESKYGYSFMDKVIDWNDFNTYTIGSEKWALVDVFYFCCSEKDSCQDFTSVEKAVILEKLADKILSYSWNIDNDARRRKGDADGCYTLDETRTYLEDLPGLETCFLMFSAGSKVSLYAGPLMFGSLDLDAFKSTEEHSMAELARKGIFCAPNFGTYSSNRSQYIGDGECLHYISYKKFFLYCCCYTPEKYKDCSSSREEEMRYAEANMRAWSAFPDIGEKSEQIVVSVSKNVTYTRPYVHWTYTDFIHSRPEEDKGGRFSPNMDNKRLFHCAFGSVNISCKNKRALAPNEPQIIPRWKVPNRQEMCSIKISIHFELSERSAADWVEISYGGVEGSECTEDDCIMVGPKCVNDLINKTSGAVTATFRCCCNDGEFCNHGSRFDRFTRTAINGRDFHCTSGVQWFFSAFETSAVKYCLRAFDYRTRKEIFVLDGRSVIIPKRKVTGTDDCSRVEVLPLVDMLCENRTLLPVEQYIICRCKVDRKSNARCDENFSFEGNETAFQIYEKPICYEGSVSLRNFSKGSAVKFKLVNTIDSPICHDTVTLHESGEIYVESGIGMLKDKKGNVRRFSVDLVLKKKVLKLQTSCYTSLATPCNGLENIRKYLLPEAVDYLSSDECRNCREIFVKKKTEPSYCYPSDHRMEGQSERLKACLTNRGCFEFRGSNGKANVSDCVDNVDNLLTNYTFLTVAAACKSRAASSQQCYGVKNVTDLEGTSGVLCCCSESYSHGCISDKIKYFHFDPDHGD